MRQSIARVLLNSYKQDFYEFCGMISIQAINESYDQKLGGKKYTFKDGSKLLACVNSGTIEII